MNIIRSYALNRANKLYKKKEFSKVLQLYSIFLTNVDEYGVYRNVFRVLSLIKTGNKSAKAEYGLMLNEDQLKLLPPADEEYINLFIFKIANENHAHLIYKYNIDDVTERTIKYFS